MSVTVFNTPSSSSLNDDLAIIQNGSTATTNITSGQYVCWNGVLKQALSNISSGDTFSSTNLGDPTNGVLNDLNSKIEWETIISERVAQAGSTSYETINVTGKSEIYVNAAWESSSFNYLRGIMIPVPVLSVTEKTFKYSAGNSASDYIAVKATTTKLRVYGTYNGSDAAIRYSVLAR